MPSQHFFAPLAAAGGVGVEGPGAVGSGGGAGPLGTVRFCDLVREVLGERERLRAAMATEEAETGGGGEGPSPAFGVQRAIDGYEAAVLVALGVEPQGLGCVRDKLRHGVETFDWRFVRAALRDLETAAATVLPRPPTVRLVGTLS